ncbi:MAG: alcohol dehydrogenase [Mycobacterium sp.]|nr:alcohol dehydrogenase [Mycobacterium sp.]MDT5346681.1 alcohol dehydrogenase [Mycobacterium sp.]MDT5372035.1 alcohol dehydrogenase [Mycobacterium sp.]
MAAGDLADMYRFLSVDREPGLCRGLCADAANEAGAGFVMVTGLGARDADRLALVSRFGADLAFDVSADDPVVELTKAAGALADVVVDVTAYRAALDLLASGRYPFASLPRRCVGLDDAEDLLATVAGERDDVPPVPGVLTP